MKVHCTTLSDFLENLKDDKVCLNRLYYEKERLTIAEDAGEPITLQISLCAYALMELGSEGQYLLELKQYCGLDRILENSSSGTKVYEGFLKVLTEFTTHHSIALKPGMLSE